MKESPSKKCSACAFANFRYNDAPVGSGYSTFLCTKHHRFKDYSDTDCGAWETRHKEANNATQNK